MKKGGRTFIEIVKGKKYVFHPIGNKEYIIGNEEYEFSILSAQYDKETKKHYVIVNEERVFLDITINTSLVKFNLTHKDLEKLNNKDTMMSLKPEQLFVNVFNFCKFYLDLEQEYDYLTLTTFICMTYQLNNLDHSFILSIIGDKNTGKTSVLDVLFALGYNYYLTKDMTGAGLMRTIEAQGINVGFDELDELNDEKQKDVENILRNSYQKNIPTTRLKSNDFEPESFYTFGGMAYTIRSGVEDALETRTIPVFMSTSSDERLPANQMTLIKKGKGLRTALYCHRLFNYILDDEYRTEHIDKAVDVIDLPMDKILTKEKVNKLRDVAYKQVLSNLSPELKDIYKSLFGRTAQLFLVFADVLSQLRLDLNYQIDDDTKLIDLIKSVFARKKELMDTGLSNMEVIVKKAIIQRYAELQQQAIVMKQGIDTADYTYTYNGFVIEKYMDFKLYLHEKLTEKKLFGVTDKKLMKTLGKLGFRQGRVSEGGNYNVSLYLTRKDGKKNTKCVIFNDKVIKNLEVSDDD